MAAPAPAPDARELRLARGAVAATFFFNGASFASWVVRIPAVQSRLGLDAGRLGVVLLGHAVGALIAMPLAGALAARRGSRLATRASALAYALFLVLPPLAPSALLLALALVVLGAAEGALNVTMNAQAAEVERRYGRPIMSSFHALYSVGGLLGASLGGFAAARGIGPVPHLAAAALVTLVVTTLGGPRYLAGDAGGARGPLFARPSRALLALGAVSLCVAFGEGAVADWSAVFLRDVTGAGAGLAAAGFAAFSLTMAAGRFAGDWSVARIGAERLVRYGGALTAAGAAVALGVATPWAAVAGFGLVGAGLATLFPIVVTTAGRMTAGTAGAAIAAIATLGHAGYIAGPPLVGLLANAVTLRVALGLIVVAGLAIAAGGRAVRTTTAAA